MVVAEGKAETVTTKVKKLDKPKLQATGTPKSSSVKKVNTKTKILIHSITRPYFLKVQPGESYGNTPRVTPKLAKFHKPRKEAPEV